MISGPPVIRDDRSAQFFDAAARDELVMRRCNNCERFLGLEARTCSSCGSSDVDWHRASGQGTLVTWSVVHHPPHPAFASEVPFAVGYVELAEGPWINARISTDLAKLRIGLPLAVAFVHPEDSDSYPIFVLQETQS